jgi:GNAT superfamily N-acetyltransferase
MAATPESFVRVARGSDATSLADLQLQCWQEAYAGVLPAASLARLLDDRDAQVERWRDSVERPPGPRYHVLVAVSGAAGDVVGSAALGPAEESPDLNPAVVGELLVLQVAAAHRRRGHGSRLVAAVADHLRADGFVEAVAWVDRGDSGTSALLATGGWAADFTKRSLDLDGDGVVVVRQGRWHTDLSTDPPPDQEDPS